MTFFLQSKIWLVNWNNYLMIKAFVLYGSMLREGEMGKINVKMENITSAQFFLRWFQHDTSMVLRNKEISCFTQIDEGLGQIKSQFCPNVFTKIYRKMSERFIHFTGKCRFPAIIKY